MSPNATARRPIGRPPSCTRRRRLFAERGYSGVSLEDLGAAVGVSGPAVYRHFENKQALLGAILVRVSERLRAGGRAVVDAGGTSRGAASRDHRVPRRLRPRATPTSSACRTATSRASATRTATRVRRLQREYVELWIGILSARPPIAQRERPARAGARVLRTHQLHAATALAGCAGRPPTAPCAASSSRWRFAALTT